MGEIINFLQYRDMKESERERLRMHSVLTNKSEYITGLLKEFDNSIGVSFVAKFVNEISQVVGKELVIDNDLYSVITEALANYKESLEEKIKKLD